VSEELFRTVLDGIGVRGDASGRRQLGLSFIISYLNGRRDLLAETVRRLLALAERLEVPLLLVLDGQNWWDGRPDLWNWWDPALPGFDPANVENVEWTDPGPEHAVKICWRNWGRQLRVRPAPNLMSPRFREAAGLSSNTSGRSLRRGAMVCPSSDVICSPASRSAGKRRSHQRISLPNGNHFLETAPDDPSADPTYGHDMTKDFAAGLVPLGYAALASEGIKPKDGRVTLADHERIVATISSSSRPLPRRRVRAGGALPALGRAVRAVAAALLASRADHARRCARLQLLQHAPAECRRLGRIARCRRPRRLVRRRVAHARADGAQISSLEKQKTQHKPGRGGKKKRRLRRRGGGGALL
jgi:hypothetical protein